MILTIDLDTAEEIDALYAIDKLSTLLSDPDPVINALSKVAWDITDVREEPFGSNRFDAADAIYPQTISMWTATDVHVAETAACEHLRRFGLMTGE